MIDYDNLKKCHELAEKIFEHFAIELFIVHGYLGRESGVLKYNYNHQTMGWDDEIKFPNIEYLLHELQKLTKPKPKYKVGQLVWHNTEEDEPTSFVVMSISQDQNGEYGYHAGLDYKSQRQAWIEEHLYPTRQDLIESQIEYWLSLSEKSPTEILCGEIVEHWQQRLADSDDSPRCEPDSDDSNQRKPCPNAHEFYEKLVCEQCGLIEEL